MFAPKSTVSTIRMPAVKNSTLEQLFVRYEDPLNTPYVSLAVTSGCNIECKYCYNYTKERVMMSPEVAIGFLKSYFHYQKINNINFPIRRVFFSGGEPTLNPDVLLKTAAYLMRVPLLCTPVVLTNGIISNQLLERLIEAKFCFQISYDGIHNPLRQTLSGKANLTNKIVETIDRVLTADLPLVLRATISEETVDGMVDMVKFAAQRKIEAIICAPMQMIGNARNHLVKQARANLHVEKLFEAYQLAKSLNIKFTPDEINRYYNNGSFREFSKTVLLPDGSLSVTGKFLTPNEMYAKNVIFGKYSVEEGLCVDTEKVENIMSNFLGNLNKNGCHHCDAFRYCRGRNLNISSFVSSSDDYDPHCCDITRAIYRKLIDSENNFDRIGEAVM